MALCESMSKPVIAAISGTCLAGGFEFALSCDLRIAEEGDYLIGLPEANLGLLPGAGGTQRLPRTIGTPAALMHILMGIPLTPREAERKGLVHETVSGKALDRAMEIAQRLSSHTPESVAYIKRLVRNATETPLAQGLALERNLFLKLCITEPALARMRSYEEKNITSPSRSIVVDKEREIHDRISGARAGHRGDVCVLEGSYSKIRLSTLSTPPYSAGPQKCHNFRSLVRGVRERGARAMRPIRWRISASSLGRPTAFVFDFHRQ